METEDNNLLMFEILIAEKYSFQKTSQEMQEETQEPVRQERKHRFIKSQTEKKRVQTTLA